MVVFSQRWCIAKGGKRDDTCSPRRMSRVEVASRKRKVVRAPAMREGHGDRLRPEEQLADVAQAGHSDDDSQAVQVGWGEHCIALQEGQSQDDGRQVLVEVCLSLQATQQMTEWRSANKMPTV